MFDELKAMGIKLDEIGESCLKVQIAEIEANLNEEDLNNEDFMRGASRVLCGALGFYIDSKYPSPFRELMLYSWLKYTFLAVIELKRQRNFNLTYELKNTIVDEFKDMEKEIEKNFDSKVTLAQEGEQDGEQRQTSSGC
jgi:hypothetical protein